MNNIKKYFSENIKSKKGVTLVEIMLSVTLLAIIVIPLLGAVISSVQNNSAAKDKNEAIALADKVMDELKASGISTTTDKIPFTGIGSGDLDAYYQITLADSGRVEKSGSTATASTTVFDTYTYNNDVAEANKADFVLEINQGDSNGSVEEVKLKDNTGNTLGELLKNINVTNTNLKFEVGIENSQYYCIFGQQSYNTKYFFVPKQSNKVILKVTFEGTAPSLAKQLRINTTISNLNFKAYIIGVADNEEANTGAKFINKGKIDFEVNYLNNSPFIYDGNALNKLYKIDVFIKKGNNEVYKTSSYVKK
jgi:Tfp pilus assembly protein PilV